jgi:heat shock protein HtpX
MGSILKRLSLFLLTNLAIIVVIMAVSFVLERFFGIDLARDAGGYAGLAVISVAYGFIGAFVSLALSKWMAKRAYGIELLSEERLMDYSQKEQLVFTTVARIAKGNGIDIPEVGVYASPDPNAFATGATKNSSLVAVSTGLLSEMTPAEIEGVVGHEMAHILNGDMVTMTLLQGVLNAFVIFFARVIGGIIDKAVFKNEEGNGWGYFASVIVLEIVLGILASFVLMGFSRHREFRADEGSSRFLGKDKMVAALRRLASLKERTDAFEDGKLATFKIVSKDSLLQLLSSHPKIEDRIANLESKHVF